MKLDTLNQWAVTAHNGKVVSLGLKLALTPDEAVRLAAWLVMGAELADHLGDHRQNFTDTIEGIE